MFIATLLDSAESLAYISNPYAFLSQGPIFSLTWPKSRDL